MLDKEGKYEESASGVADLYSIDLETWSLSESTSLFCLTTTKKNVHIMTCWWPEKFPAYFGKIGGYQQRHNPNMPQHSGPYQGERRKAGCSVQHTNGTMAKKRQQKMSYYNQLQQFLSYSNRSNYNNVEETRRQKDGHRETEILTVIRKHAMDCFIVSRFYQLKADEVFHFFMEVADDVFNQQNSTNIRRVFNATMLEWYCGYANGRQQCILECDNDSFLKTQALKLLRPTSYICNETDFITYSKCYRQVYEDDVDECESGDKCLPYKTTMIDYAYRNRKRVQNISWQNAAQVVLNNLCQYIICGNQCRMNELSKQCGEESNQVLIEFYRRVVSSLKQITIELEGGYKKE
uniref:Uncharacterized protein n=1 Tax=Romanomermis culicivorax TaxID=13658 RepID=A0A915KQL1_ROMCU